MTEHTDTDNHEVAILDIANDTKTMIEFIIHERLQVIQTLANRSKLGKIPDDSNNRHLFERLRMLLRWLDQDVQITMELKDKTKIDVGLQLMFKRPQYHFPEEDAKRAKRLFEKWESENWGANEVIDDENENNGDSDGSEASEEPQPKRRRKSISSKPKDETDAPTAKLLLPPRNHPIFGEHGIAHGVAIKRGKKRDYVLDRRFTQREAKVYGHNGLSVGTWFPVRMVALFYGAHGSTQGGISGNTQTGAYSIVVAGSYEELDQDQGETLIATTTKTRADPQSLRPGPLHFKLLTPPRNQYESCAPQLETRGGHRFMA